jgi:hypothetical protein
MRRRQRDRLPCRRTPDGIGRHLERVRVSPGHAQRRRRARHPGILAAPGERHRSPRPGGPSRCRVCAGQERGRFRDHTEAGRRARDVHELGPAVDCRDVAARRGARHDGAVGADAEAWRTPSPPRLRARRARAPPPRTPSSQLCAATSPRPSARPRRRSCASANPRAYRWPRSSQRDRARARRRQRLMTASSPRAAAFGADTQEFEDG